MNRHGTILVIDDEEIMREILETLLTREGYHVRLVGTAAEGLDLARTMPFDAAIVDVMMPGMDGISALDELKKIDDDLPVLMITAFASVENAIAAMKRGAFDYITKPFKNDEVLVVLRNALAQRRLVAENRALRQNLQAHANRFGEIIGRSSRMRQVFDLIIQAAPSRTTILINGESGTGKELVARELHRRSPRASGPFVAINCGAIPPALLESELFGHTRGAFTDAHRARPGLVQEARGGTFFLDELVDLPRALQTKLLRVLQEHAVRPVGGDRDLPVDVRVVAATNQDAEHAVRDGRLRKDLYFRLNVIGIEVPPLRARGTDVLVLAQCFVNQFAARARKRVSGVSAAAAKRLLAYAWPGNVRELQNCIERAVALTESDRIAVGDLPDAVRAGGAQAVAPETQALETLAELERRHIIRVLESVGGHRNTAARILGLDRKTLYRKLVGYGLIKTQDREP